MTTHDQIKRGMALAFFASAYADMAEECDQSLYGEIMDQLPDEIDPAAIHAADTLAVNVLWQNMGINSLDSLYSKVIRLNAEDKGDRELTPELFGHYLAMQAMGHGVGLESFGDAVYNAIRVPYVEFGSHSLQKDYFEMDENN